MALDFWSLWYTRLHFVTEVSLLRVNRKMIIEDSWLSASVAGLNVTLPIQRRILIGARENITSR